MNASECEEAFDLLSVINSSTEHILGITANVYFDRGVAWEVIDILNENIYGSDVDDDGVISSCETPLLAVRDAIDKLGINLETDSAT